MLCLFYGMEKPASRSRNIDQPHKQERSSNCETLSNALQHSQLQDWKPTMYEFFN